MTFDDLGAKDEKFSIKRLLNLIFLILLTQKLIPPPEQLKYHKKISAVIIKFVKC